ncbi:MAG: bifunctional riboflavin kinase/FAD synthetase [Clostridia bacterium]|nr:bifunctional riboflavin kinase/FAD synthetase [Clostridia bacterium]
MKIIPYATHYREPISLALGFFDSLHLGHQALIREAKRDDCQLAVFTFGQNLYANVSKHEPLVLTFEERVDRLADMGVDVVIRATPDREFLSTRPIDFLDTLLDTLDIISITVGTDYTYGVGGEGNVDSLREFCTSHSIALNVVDLLSRGLHKIGTRYVRKAITLGDISEANAMLGYDYYMIGEVVSGDSVGRTLGYPTANLKVEGDKVMPPLGVYATIVEIGGERYKGMTAISDRPTFLAQEVTIETYILDFEEDIYGESIKVSFVEKIRDNIKFSSTTQLRDRLAQDEMIVRELNYD